MADHFFVHLQGMNEFENRIHLVLCFHSLKEAEAYVQDWLMKKCAVECISEARAEEVRERLGGKLPEMALVCPTLREPADLVKYNNFYFFGEGGNISLFMEVIWDETTAKRFVGSVIKEYKLDTTFSEEADEMMDMLDVMVESFRSDADASPLLEKLNALIAQGGLSLF